MRVKRFMVPTHINQDFRHRRVPHVLYFLNGEQKYYYGIILENIKFDFQKYLITVLFLLLCFDFTLTSDTMFRICFYSCVYIH
jgi:hypothetical protein